MSSNSSILDIWKKCNFQQTVNDTSINATCAVFTLINSKFHKRHVFKLHNSLVTPIRLYGSEIWGPYIDYDYNFWEKSKIESIHTQFIKWVIGCNIQTIEVGTRLLLLNIVKRVINYTKSLTQWPVSTVYAAYWFESENGIQPNLCIFLNNLR